MTKKLVQAVKVIRVGGMSDKELAQSLAVDDGHHVLRGVREIIDRLDDHYDNTFCDISVAPQVRADAGILKAGLRELRRAIADWNMAHKREPQQS